MASTRDPASIESANTALANTKAEPTTAQRTSTDHAERLENAAPLERESFPNPPRRENAPVPTTIPNVRQLLQQYGITVRYNLIKKTVFVSLPRHAGTPDNAANVALNHILSLAVLNGMPTGLVPGFVEVVADENPWNPVADWITSKPWDAADRLPAMYDTLTIREGFDNAFKEQIMYCWLLSCVAAAFTPTGFTCRGVLTIQGAQGLGKTRWIASLVPDAVLRDEVVRLGHHLDARNKDDVISAVCHWIVEIGELDSSFKKDVAALKGFLTNDRDKIRRPYGKADSEYPRKTVFAATVNDNEFLVDSTGNTRFWTLPVIAINYAHGIDMQQVFAQLLIAFRKGKQWWLTDDDEVMLEAFNREHRKVSAIRDLIANFLEVNRRDDAKVCALTATAILGLIGYEHPTNPQLKECNSALRELLGEPKRSKGQNRWRIPMSDRYPPPMTLEDDDRY